MIGIEFLLEKANTNIQPLHSRIEVYPEYKREEQGDKRQSTKYAQNPNQNGYFSVSSAFLLMTSISSAKLLVLRICEN